MLLKHYSKDFIAEMVSNKSAGSLFNWEPPLTLEQALKEAEEISIGELEGIEE
jgi:hypothetical protein